jgi:DNA-binding transcriptional LysR family regulator
MLTLVAAADAGSLSEAARRSRMPLATVSRRVADLEQYLGTALLQRSKRALSLTEAGRAYVDACKRILEQVDEAERVARGEYRELKGQLFMAAPLVLGKIHAVPVVAEFLQAHPSIDARLALSDRVVSFSEERVDVALRVGELPDSVGLLASRVGEVTTVVCGSPDYFARRGEPETPDALGEHDCITFDGIASPQSWTFSAESTSKRVRIRSRLVVNTAEAAIEAAKAGLGVTRVLSYQLVPAEAAGALRRVLAPFQPRALPVHLVCPGQPLASHKLRAFIDFAVPRLRKRLGYGRGSSSPNPRAR